MNEFKISQEQISHSNIDGIINAFSAMVKGEILEESWKKILIEEKIAGNANLQDKLHDYLMEHGEEIETEEQLKQAILEIKK